jgi:hypothetical protein
MEIPVYLNGEAAGMLRVSREGLYTVIEAEAPGQGGLVRLWVHGGGKSAYLGVMQPVDGGLSLRRRCSRSVLAAFPEPMEFASDMERDERDEAFREEAEKTDDKAGEEESKKTEEREEGAAQTPETDYHACPWPAEPPEEGLLWYRRTDGSLVSFDGISSLVAIPSALRGGVPQGAERMIEGKKYLVFRY